MALLDSSVLVFGLPVIQLGTTLSLPCRVRSLYQEKESESENNNNNNNNNNGIIIIPYIFYLIPPVQNYKYTALIITALLIGIRIRVIS